MIYIRSVSKFVNLDYSFTPQIRQVRGKNRSIWWRDNDDSDHPWYTGQGGTFAIVDGSAPIDPVLIQSNFGHKGNFELAVQVSAGQLQHWWRDNDDSNLPWHAGEKFGQ